MASACASGRGPAPGPALLGYDQQRHQADGEGGRAEPVDPALAAVGLELMYRVTDPPVKLLKKLIPAVRIGNMSLDLSMMILLIVVYIVMRVIDPR